MFHKQECVAMLLAGGQGSRLGVLTKELAKPAVPYGGKYRIIDFPLSNCVNSGITTVGVLTQYQPLILNEYIGTGQPWDLDHMQGGVQVLPPYQKSRGGNWYKGTANAIQQNIPFIKRYNPDHVLVLSGDHIYKMDYSQMIGFHKQNDADCTIAVLEVPMEEASRFGILNINEDNSIYEFDEKPKVPKSNLASMGIYVFDWKKLHTYLEADGQNPKSQNDFGKNVLPAMLEAGERMFAYRFDGYWKDVGTIDSLWEANMDLLDPKVDLDLSDPGWRIYARNEGYTPQYISPTAVVQNALVADGSMIHGQVDSSVIFSGSIIEQDAVVRDSIVMPGARIGAGAEVQYAIIGESAVVASGAKIGMRPENSENLDEWGIAVVGSYLTVGANAVVPPKAMVESNIEEVSLP